MAEKTAEKCDYCGFGYARWVTPLFRYIESYDNELVSDGECGNCKGQCAERKEGYSGTCENCELYSDCETEYDCSVCDRQPVYNQNQINVTIFVEDGNLVFEDKEDGCHKERVKINYCPMCGRSLEGKLEGAI